MAKDNNANLNANGPCANTITTNNSLRDTQVRCLIAYNTLMNKSLSMYKMVYFSTFILCRVK